MVDYNIEFSKGVLFIRLYGILNRFNEKDIEEQIYEIINEGGIRYLVINTEDVEIQEDVMLFKNCNDLIKNNDGKMLICGSNIEEYDYIVDELSAFKEFSS